MPRRGTSPRGPDAPVGKWMIHCHIPHHTTNNNTEQEGGGGLMMHIEVEGDPTT